ncbi:MAG TPA: peptidoglycan-binding domain-containing protein [Cellulomonadaceae bacterium]|nr:peptidoglycan-binding domain-containing protein [Cellulomonadaceae bacterium]
MARIAHVQDPRRRVAALTSAAVVVVVTLGLVGARGSRADATDPAAAVPTATVATRSMAVTSTVGGTVQRASRYEVTVGDTRVAAVPQMATGGSGGGATSASAVGVTGTAAVTSVTAQDPGSVALVSYVTALPAGVIVVPTVEPTVTPTGIPTDVPTDTPTTVPTDVPTSDPTPIPTVSPTPVPTTKPGTSPTTGTPPTSSVPSEPSPSSRTGAVPTGAVPTGGASAGSVPTASPLPQSTGQSTTGATSSTPSATLTALAALGTTVTSGTVLYAADGEPVIAVEADAVFWRDLEIGVDDGADVRALEVLLTALGYGDGLTVDDAFTSVTAAAVERWEADLGRLGPDGVVTLGDLVAVPDACEVTARLLQPGDVVRSGTAVLTLASSAQVVGAEVDAEDVADWPAGAAVTVAWSDGGTTAAHVVATGRDVVDGRVTLTVGFDVEVPGRATGTPVTVVRTADQRDGVLTVPVAAIVADAVGHPGVVVLDGGARRQVPVSVGVVVDGWVEVSGGLVAGDRVVLPG